ncbi:MAG TPA: mercuric reductase [Alphaproteobacteria bacterium]|nr:mercuric reductase [Alphaproteobacteria bacterium]
MGNLQALEPKSAFNRELESNTRPPDWVNPKPEGPYNLVVIGAGTAGLVAAAGAAGLGAKVALIERNLMGGDCLNVGCVPSKGLIRAARAAAAVRNAGQFGIEAGGNLTCDFSEAMQRMRRLRAKISKHDSAARFRDMGVDVYIGEGRFSGPDTVEVEGQTLMFNKAVIATGSRAAAPPIDGLDGVDYLTNESLFSLTELPERLGIIGAGPIGSEMGQTFAQLGSEVYLVDSNHGILQKEDADCSSIVQAAMEQDGVKLFCCGKKVRVSASRGSVRLQLESHDESYDHTVDRLLVAVGRAPNIENLNLEAAGVETNKHGVIVDDKLRTANHNIFAAGDVCTKYKFTHVADFMARIVIQNALFMGHSRFSDLVIPWCTYTTPEIAHVGITGQEAEQQGLDIDTYRRGFDEVDRAVLDGESEGFIKIHCGQGKDTILGATIVAHDAGNMISEITLAMNNNVGLGGIGGTIHPYPTQAEAVRQLGDQYKRTKLTPLVESLFDRWMTWRR